MEALTWVGLAALALKVVSFLKYAAARDWTGFQNQAVTWLAGVSLVMVAAQADLAASLVVAERPLADFDVWSQILIGLSLGAAGSVAYDYKKALDGTDTAKEPSVGIVTRSDPPP